MGRSCQSEHGDSPRRFGDSQNPHSRGVVRCAAGALALAASGGRRLALAMCECSRPEVFHAPHHQRVCGGW